MICDGDSNAYEAIKHIYMIDEDGGDGEGENEDEGNGEDEDGGDGGDEDEGGENGHENKGINQRKVVFPVAILMHFDLLF